jgi:hypothetical protein
MVLTDKDLFHGIFHPGYLVILSFWSFRSIIHLAIAANPVIWSLWSSGHSCHPVIWSFQSSGYSGHFGYSARVRQFRLYIFSLKSELKQTEIYLLVCFKYSLPFFRNCSLIFASNHEMTESNKPK